VQGGFDLVLQVQVRAFKQPEQARQVCGEQVVGQGRVGDQVGCGWRHRSAAAAAGNACTRRRFCPPRLDLGLAVQHPDGPLAHKPRPVQATLTVSIPAGAR
jgi:hypothetical protein